MTVTDRTAATEQEFRDRIAAFETAPTPPEVREVAVLDEVARERRFTETAMRCLDRALEAMNRAIEITTADGPAKGIEFIADFLNDTDGIDEAVAAAAPDDWLTRWQVTPAAAVAAYRAAQDGGAEEAVRRVEALIDHMGGSGSSVYRKAAGQIRAALAPQAGEGAR